MKIEKAKRLGKLPPYLFIEIDKKKQKLISEGKDIINLGVGDPDMPTPSHIIKAMKKALDNPSYHQYPFGAGLIEFRQAIANWYQRRFNVSLNPEKEIHPLIGSKEGIGHLPLAIVDSKDVVLIPEPSYPVYNASTIFADGIPYHLPLLEENDFLPDLKSIPEDILKKAKLIFINYPGNPTSAVAPAKFFEEVVSFAKKYNIIVAHDAAYSEIYFEEKPLSFLEIDGAKEVGIEFHSLSKTYNMTGWRCGWTCGNEVVTAALKKVKDNFDSGVFGAVQAAGIEALSASQDCVEKMREIYKERRDVFFEGLKKIGWKGRKPPATFYIWAKTPTGCNSFGCVEKLLDEASIVVTPGNGLGKSGEGYVRFSLTVKKERLKEAVQRISKINWQQ